MHQSPIGTLGGLVKILIIQGCICALIIHFRQHVVVLGSWYFGETGACFLIKKAG